jgi:hypothetical protein
VMLSPPPLARADRMDMASSILIPLRLVGCDGVVGVDMLVARVNSKAKVRGCGVNDVSWRGLLLVDARDYWWIQ